MIHMIHFLFVFVTFYNMYLKVGWTTTATNHSCNWSMPIYFSFVLGINTSSYWYLRYKNSLTTVRRFYHNPLEQRMRCCCIKPYFPCSFNYRKKCLWIFLLCVLTHLPLSCRSTFSCNLLLPDLVFVVLHIF